MENAAMQRSVTKTKYGFAKEVAMPFDEAVQRSKEILLTEGFGVLSEIRMDEKFKEKLGVDFRKYIILGACNPPLAYKTVQEDVNIGLLLPCNVIVYESDDPNNSIVAAVDAKAMLSVAEENDVMQEVSSEVSERLKRVLEQV